MKGKTFLILLLAAGLLSAVVLLDFKSDDTVDGPKMGAKLLADLPVNQVARVVIADDENHTTLVKGATVWQVAERSGYPADFEELRDTVVKLSRLKIGRSFAGDAESLARLSLLDPSDPNASARGKRITLKDAAGKILADLILGQIRSAENGGSGGQYLKNADGDTVFLVDAGFQFLKTAPAEWLEKEVLNIKAEAVQTVACFAGDANTPVYTLVRPEKGQDAQLAPLPEGRSVDAARIDQVLDAMAPLSLDDVQPAEGPAVASSGQTRLVYTLYDGREITVYPGVEGEDSYNLRVTARQIDGAPAPAEEEQSEAAEADASEEAASEQDDAASKTAEQINADLGPWVFSIKKWQFDSFVTQLESLLEEVKEDG